MSKYATAPPGFSGRGDYIICLCFVAVGVLFLPVPGIAAHIFQVAFRFPAELPVCFVGIGIAGSDVAGTARGDFIRHIDPIDPLESLHDIQHAVAIAGAEIIYINAGLF